MKPCFLKKINDGTQILPTSWYGLIMGFLCPAMWLAVFLDHINGREVHQKGFVEQANGGSTPSTTTKNKWFFEAQGWCLIGKEGRNDTDTYTLPETNIAPENWLLKVERLLFLLGRPSCRGYISFGEGMYVIYTHCFLFMIPASRKSNRSPFYKSTLRVLEIVEIVNLSMMEFPQVDVAQSVNEWMYGCFVFQINSGFIQTLFTKQRNCEWLSSQRVGNSLEAKNIAWKMLPKPNRNFVILQAPFFREKTLCQTSGECNNSWGPACINSKVCPHPPWLFQ